MENNENEIQEENIKKTDKKQEIKELFITFIACVALFVFIRAFIAVPVVTNGESMSPTLVHGDMIIVEKLSYIFSEPKKDDIIVFPYPADPNKEYIKRVIGVPGDEIDVIDSNIIINGEQWDDPFALSPLPLGDTQFPLVVGEDEYFVLGDNRIVSHDSRYSEVGLIKKDDILGHAFFVFYPFNRMGLVD